MNITLKRDFEGVVARGSFGSSRYSDGNGAKISAAAGFGNLADDRYNIFSNVELGDNDRIVVSDRKDRGYVGTGDLRAFGYSIGGSQFMSGSITPGNAASSPAGSVRDLHDVAIPVLAGLLTVLGSAARSERGLPLGYGKFRDLSPEQKYVNGFTRGTFALTETSEVYTELGYSRADERLQQQSVGYVGLCGVFPAVPSTRAPARAPWCSAPLTRTTRTACRCDCVTPHSMSARARSTSPTSSGARWPE